jgi:DNA topoisomerase-1
MRRTPGGYRRAVPSLRHSSDREAGYTRRRRGRGVQYVDARGRTVTSPALLARFEALAIPPAWRDVWICRSSRGHLQATGVDAAGRKQYRYHPRWREMRDREKHDRILRFADALPDLRAAVASDLRARDLHRDKALAAAVRLLDRTWIRVGGERYASGASRTFGLATLRSRHLRIDGATVVIDFVGKGGVRQHAELEDRTLARVLAEMDALPGWEVLKFRAPDGGLCDVRSADVNAYIRDRTGDVYTAKDFRTWAGTVAAAIALDEIADVPPGRRRERAVAGAMRQTAAQLGNTPAVCRASYVDPRVVDHYLEGRTLRDVDEELLDPERPHRTEAERLVLALLRMDAAVAEPLEAAAAA